MESRVIEIVHCIESKGRGVRYSSLWKRICQRFLTLYYFSRKYLDRALPSRTVYSYRIIWRGAPIPVSTKVVILGRTFIVVSSNEMVSFFEDPYERFSLDKGRIKVFLF